jgi:hypothetical protein
MTSQKILTNHLNPSSLLRRGWVLVFLVVASLALCPMAQAVDPAAPDTALAGGNTADGHLALAGLTTGTYNSAFGVFSLLSLSTASFDTGLGAGTLFTDNGGTNTAVGAGALFSNKIASDNNAVGAFALFSNDSDGAGTADFNNAHGRNALLNNVDGDENDSFGDDSMESNTTGSMNTAMGDDALDLNTTGSGNTAIGKEAANSIVDGSNNIAIGHNAGIGIVHASNQIAIGAEATGPFADIGPTCFIGSTYNEPPSDVPSNLAVFIDSNNVLNTPASTRRVKHDIKPMDKASEALYALKPVSFIYNSDRTGTTVFGLIAEDVAKVHPSLASYRAGEPIAVKYDQVNAMLLNEFLKEHRKVEEQQASIGQLKSEMQTMVAQLKEQAAQIQKVSAQLELSKPADRTVQNKQ